MDAAQKVQELPIVHCTLVLPVSNDRVLLGYKKRGFGADKYNGIGGKLDQGETSEQAAVREAQEEVGITPTMFTKMADLSFLEWHGDKQGRVHVDVYVCEEWHGDMIETDEMRPEWFPCEKPPYRDMPEDMPLWLPQVLAGERVVGKFTLDQDDQVTAHRIEFVDEF